MTFMIEPKNKNAEVIEYPNGFWPAFCVETPVSNILECHYKDETEKVIVYYHDGYVGEWINEDDALTILNLLSRHIHTDEYKNHRYFSTRHDQMLKMMDFLKTCGGFRMKM